MSIQIISNRVKPLADGIQFIIEIITYTLIGNLFMVVKETKVQTIKK